MADLHLPTTPLAIATPAQATHAASSTGVTAPTGVGEGETHHDLKSN